jgi:WD40-like Beta Propeller Repeat
VRRAIRRPGWAHMPLSQLRTGRSENRVTGAMRWTAARSRRPATAQHSSLEGIAMKTHDTLTACVVRGGLPVLLALLVAAGVAACGGTSTAASNSPSATPLPTPTVAGTIAFERMGGWAATPTSTSSGAHGTRLRPVAEAPGWEDHPSWSPDGSQIAFAVFPRQSQLPQRPGLVGGERWSAGDVLLDPQRQSVADEGRQLQRQGADDEGFAGRRLADVLARRHACRLPPGPGAARQLPPVRSQRRLERRASGDPGAVLRPVPPRGRRAARSSSCGDGTNTRTATCSP